MTDEKLIEAADEYTRRNIGGMQPVTTIGDKVHAAFLAGAVFEKAHAPTGDEREPQSEDQGPAANCAYCVGAGGYEDHDGDWAECSCQLPEPQGEPSEVQVEAQVTMFIRNLWPLTRDRIELDRTDPWTTDRIREALRAALRAAGEVK